MIGGVVGSHRSPRVVAHAGPAILGAFDVAVAAVLPVVEEVDAPAVAAGLPELAHPLAQAAVRFVFLGVDAREALLLLGGGAGALDHAAILPGAPGLLADPGLLVAVVVGQRRRELVRQEAASPEPERRGVG